MPLPWGIEAGQAVVAVGGVALGWLGAAMRSLFAFRKLRVSSCDAQFVPVGEIDLAGAMSHLTGIKPRPLDAKAEARIKIELTNDGRRAARKVIAYASMYRRASGTDMVQGSLSAPTIRGGATATIDVTLRFRHHAGTHGVHQDYIDVWVLMHRGRAIHVSLHRFDDPRRTIRQTGLRKEARVGYWHHVAARIASWSGEAGVRRNWKFWDSLGVSIPLAIAMARYRTGMREVLQDPPESRAPGPAA